MRSPCSVPPVRSAITPRMHVVREGKRGAQHAWKRRDGAVHRFLAQLRALGPHVWAACLGRKPGGAMARTMPGLAAALLLAAVPARAAAQDFPSHYITIVSPFQAGGPSDTVARLIAGPMAKALGQQVVVENLSGAGGTIGSNRVARAV